MKIAFAVILAGVANAVRLGDTQGVLVQTSTEAEFGALLGAAAGALGGAAGGDAGGGGGDAPKPPKAAGTGPINVINNSRDGPSGGAGSGMAQAAAYGGGMMAPGIGGMPGGVPGMWPPQLQVDKDGNILNKINMD